MRTARPFALATAVAVAAVALAVVGGAGAAPASSAALAGVTSTPLTGTTTTPTTEVNPTPTETTPTPTETTEEDGGLCRYGDLNGDGEPRDTVVGDPDATVGGKAKAGAIWIRPAKDSGGFGTAVRVIQGTQGVPGSPGSGDRFGAAIRVVDFDDDACVDVVIAAPGERRAGRTGAGSVTVIFGSPAGLGKGPASLVLSATTTGDAPQTDEHFGSVLAVDHFPAVLAVGRPNKNVAGHSGAGAVTLFRFEYPGRLVARRTFTQNSAHVGGHAEKGDRFGSAIGFTSIDLVVGVPGENASKGIVQILTWAHPETPVTESQNWSLDTKGVPGTARAGDRFGAALAVGYYSMIIGVPGRDVGSATNAGAILAARITRGYDPLGDPTTLGHAVLVSQDTKTADGVTVAGKAETGDAFGSVVTYDGCRTSRPGSCIVVGIPGEDVSGHKDAGAIWVATDRTLNDIGVGDVVVTQGTRGIPGAVQTGNRFGAALSLVNSSLLSIGVPGDHAHPHGSVIRLELPFLYGVRTDTAAEQWTPSSGVSAGAALSDLDAG